MDLNLQAKFSLVLVLFTIVGFILFDIVFLARERLRLTQKIQADHIIWP